MPKMTAKYAGALATQRHHNGNLSLPFDQRIVVPDRENQEALYQALQEAGYFWDSAAKSWDYHEPAQADDPTPLIMIRAWAAGEIVGEAVDDLRAALAAHPRTKSWQLVERSLPYQCRPPKQRESRIYLKFMPNSKEAS